MANIARVGWPTPPCSGWVCRDTLCRAQALCFVTPQHQGRTIGRAPATMKHACRSVAGAEGIRNLEHPLTAAAHRTSLGPRWRVSATIIQVHTHPQQTTPELLSSNQPMHPEHITLTHPRVLDGPIPPASVPFRCLQAPLLMHLPHSL
jgi:hypothetical protein